MDEKEIARFFDCCETPGQRKMTRKLSMKARKHLLEAVGREGLAGGTVLEIGCGRGELLMEFLRRGAGRGMGIDLAREAISQATEAASESGLSGRLEFRVGNGAEEELPRHDAVILDKVICCYPDWKGLIDNTAGAAERIYGFVIPRSHGIGGVLIKTFVAVGNAAQRLRGCGFRGFVHDRKKIHLQLESLGFVRRDIYQGPIWTSLVYVRG